MVITILNFSDPSGARLRHLLAKSMSGSLRLEAVLGNHILTIIHRHVPQVAAGRKAGEVRPLVLRPLSHTLLVCLTHCPQCRRQSPCPWSHCVSGWRVVTPPLYQTIHCEANLRHWLSPSHAEDSRQAAKLLHSLDCTSCSCN